MRTTLLGSLLEAAQHNRARGIEDVRPVRVRRRVPGPRRRAARTAAGAEPTGNPWYRAPRPGSCPIERTAPRRAAHRPRAPGDVARAGRRRGRTSSPPRASSRRSPRAAGGLVGARPRASRSCIPAAPRGCCSPAARPAGSASCTRMSPPRGTSTRRAALRARPRGLLADAAPGVPALRGPHLVPRRPPGPRGQRARRRAGRRAWSRSCARRAARCCARAEVFDVYRGAQVGEGRVVARPAARVPRAGPHADRRGRRPAAREDRRRARRAAGRRAACLASPCSARAATRAPSPPCSCTAIRASSSRT